MHVLVPYVMDWRLPEIIIQTMQIGQISYYPLTRCLMMPFGLAKTMSKPVLHVGIYDWWLYAADFIIVTINRTL